MFNIYLDGDLILRCGTLEQAISFLAQDYRGTVRELQEDGEDTSEFSLKKFLTNYSIQKSYPRPTIHQLIAAELIKND